MVPILFPKRLRSSIGITGRTYDSLVESLDKDIKVDSNPIGTGTIKGILIMRWVI